MNLLQKLEEYFRNTPKEQLDKDWEELKEYNEIGPDVDEYIKSVEDFSAAEKAGLKAGDVITEADGKTITKMDELNEIKNSHQIGDSMNLKINREGKEIDITVTLQEQ